MINAGFITALAGLVTAIGGVIALFVHVKGNNEQSAKASDNPGVSEVPEQLHDSG
jgi:hypothetical protein